MTAADGAIVEMLEGDELVYLAASGRASSMIGSARGGPGDPDILAE